MIKYEKKITGLSIKQSGKTKSPIILGHTYSRSKKTQIYEKNVQVMRWTYIKSS